MIKALELEYYYGNESEQFQFYPVPVELFTNPCYEGLSTDAKLLYGIMLSLLHLSRKNSWVDENGRAYIKMTLRTIKLKMRCERDKAMKLLKELDVATGIGLIEKQKIKEGEAPRIYIKNFCKKAGASSGLIVQKGTDNSGLIVQKSDDNGNNKPVEKIDGVEKTDRSEESTSAENPTGGSRDNRPEGVGKTDMNYISLNNTESENIRILPSGSKEKQSGGAEIDPMDEINAYIELIKENLHYDILRERYTGTDAELYESIFRVICHVVTGKGKKYHKIGNLQFPQETVKSVFLKLRQKHVGIVMEGYNKTVTEVTDMNAYLIASLYNAYLTGDLYWDRRVRHDMYGGGNEEQ